MIELYQQTTFNYRTDRYCKRTTVINGVTIPKGAIVTIPISLLQHSPLYWEDPGKFDPDRYKGYLPFKLKACNSLGTMLPCTELGRPN